MRLEEVRAPGKRRVDLTPLLQLLSSTMHSNAPGMAAFTLASNLVEMLVAKNLLSRSDLNSLLEKCAQLNDSVPANATTTNADAAALIRALLK